MDIIKHTTQWVNGEVLQGRIGFGIGILIGILFLYFANFQHSFYKGMILPFVILQLILLGYSSSLMLMRPKHIEKVAQSLTISEEKAQSEELERSQKEDKVFSILRPIWAMLFVVSLILFFVFANDFYRGMSLGFVAFFMVAFTFDTFLHLRLKTYLLALQALN